MALSGGLTGKLGRDVDELSMNLVRLQTALGLGNVALHLLMITLILRAFSRRADSWSGPGGWPRWASWPPPWPTT